MDTTTNVETTMRPRPLSPPPTPPPVAARTGMQAIPLDEVGPRVLPDGRVRFALYLPWIHSRDFEVELLVLHEDDQFLQEVPPRAFPLDQTDTHSTNDAYWETTLRIAPDGDETHWGNPGRYVYRYRVTQKHGGKRVDWVVDPFAREFSVGKMAVVELGGCDYQWSASERTWRVPPLRDLVVYELHLQEFAGDLEGALSRLDYLRDLGVNCLEILPVSNIVETLRWGFQPLGFFGVDDRFGTTEDLKRLVDEAHQRGIAIILDVVFGHVGSNFPYAYLYRELGFHEEPFCGAAFGKDFGFGERTNFDRPYVEDFFFSVVQHLLDRFHVDGFRYDCVPEYWDPERMRGYHRLVYSTYNAVKAHVSAGAPYWSRFSGASGELTLIQCAEQLEAPRAAVNDTYGNATWQNETADAAEAVARTPEGPDRSWAIESFGQRLALFDYRRERTLNGEKLPKSAFQYLESHDKSRFISHFGSRSDDYHLFPTGDRSGWYRAQPYLIALLLAPGIPMLWQGQELCEDSTLPGSGEGRVGLLRPVRWELFYDEPGRGTLGLVRKLLALRKKNGLFRSGEHYFENEAQLTRSDVLVYRRYDDAGEAIVAVNFSSQDRGVQIAFPRGGTYAEELHGGPLSAQPGQRLELTLPSNYGRVWSTRPASP